MKRLLTAALAAATFAAPLAIPSVAAADDDDRRRWHRDRDDDDHRGRRHHRRDRDWDRDDRRDYRDDRRHYRDGYRDGRRAQRHWDRSRYNGYTYRGRWYYGPPPSHYDYVDYGWRSWRRGDRLPSYYRDYYRPVDYRYYRLRPPPRGYHYVRDDRGDYLLVGIATGVILGVILANN
jgi:Ni/Co efflux regulator RcnB